jgi:hypothetical protein
MDQNIAEASRLCKPGPSRPNPILQVGTDLAFEL